MYEVCTMMRTPSVMAMIVFALDRVVGITIMAMNEFEE